MKPSLRQQWSTVPGYIRKPIVFVVGWFFIVMAGLLGWLPGPGGIPLFLIGIAILSTEFRWAMRIKVIVMDLVLRYRRWHTLHPRSSMTIIAALSILAIAVIAVAIAMFMRVL